MILAIRNERARESNKKRNLDLSKTFSLLCPNPSFYQNRKQASPTMDLFTNQIYPLHQDNELLFKISSFPISTNNSDPPPHDQDHKIIINQDIFLLSPPPPSASSTTKLQDIKKRRRLHNTGGGGGGGTGTRDDKHEAVGGHDGGVENNKRKKLIMHRDIERQRRQEMASLYKSLRSLLPLQYLKGRRSMGDHMHEATNYIRHLEKKIKELNEKRDRLQRLSTYNNNISNPAVQMKCFCRSEVVTVQQCLAGIEVVLSCTDLLGFELGRGATVLSLSKVLDIIVQEGLDVVSCISTKASKTLVHTILSEVRCPNDTINLSELQQKLEDFIRKSCQIR